MTATLNSRSLVTGAVDARPQRLDMHLYQGDDLSFRVNVTGLVLGGASVATAQIRPRPSSPDAVDLVVALVPPRTLLVSLDAAATAALPVGDLVWDLQVVIGGLTRTLLAGKVTVDAEVTR